MNLALTPLQRAMLKEMRISFWWPTAPRTAQDESAPAMGMPESAVQAQVQAQIQERALAPSAPVVVPITPPSPAVTAPRAVVTAAHNHTDTVTTGAPRQACWHPAQALYGTDSSASGGWLIVTEKIWTGDDALHNHTAARLLDNMLRAMHLHQHGRVHLVGVELLPAPSTEGEAAPSANVNALDWPTVLQQHQPDRVLLMGRVAAQQALGTQEPLGRLRGQVHTMHGVRALVTYDAAHLLRVPADKARAWEDLCMALELMPANT